MTHITALFVVGLKTDVWHGHDSVNFSFQTMHRPSFRIRDDGSLVLSYSKEASDVFRSRKPRAIAKPPDVLEMEAKHRVQQRGDDVSDPRQVLGEMTVQFGNFQGQTFRWLCENALSYAGWIADDSRDERESPNSSHLTINKVNKMLCNRKITKNNAA